MSVEYVGGQDSLKGVLLYDVAARDTMSLHGVPSGGMAWPALPGHPMDSS